VPIVPSLALVLKAWRKKNPKAAVAVDRQKVSTSNEIDDSYESTSPARRSVVAQSRVHVPEQHASRAFVLAHCGRSRKRGPGSRHAVFWL